MVVQTAQTTRAGCWRPEHWLSDCVGFQVIAPDSCVGYVEEIKRSEDGLPVALVVRLGLFEHGTIEVPVEWVVDIRPADERLLLAVQPALKDVGQPTVRPQPREREPQLA
jgi:hypothetical protein